MAWERPSGGKRAGKDWAPMMSGQIAFDDEDGHSRFQMQCERRPMVSITRRGLGRDQTGRRVSREWRSSVSHPPLPGILLSPRLVLPHPGIASCTEYYVAVLFLL